MDNCRHQVVVVAGADAADKSRTCFARRGCSTRRCNSIGRITLRLSRSTRKSSGIRCRSDHPPAKCAAVLGHQRGLFPSDLVQAQSLAYEHWIRPVEFRKTIEHMYAEGVRLFVEVGPRGNLTAFVDDILAGRTFAAIPANVSRRSGLSQLNHLLAQLAAHGVALTLAPLYRRRLVRAIDLTATSSSTSPKRLLGPLKIPTGAPEMRVSPDVAAHLRARCRAAAPAESGATGVGAAHQPPRSRVETLPSAGSRGREPVVESPPEDAWAAFSETKACRPILYRAQGRSPRTRMQHRLLQ